MCDLLVESGTFIKLNEEKRPNSFLARSDPSDVARVEDRTFICSRDEERCRPDEQLDGSPRDARDARPAVRRLHARAGRCTSCRSAWGRSARRSPRSGVEITDSPYVVANMRIMTRMGRAVLDVLGDGRRLRAVHALGRHAARAGPGRRAVAVQRRRSTSSTSPRSARSGRYGSGYGGNALLGKKCLALRIASKIARDEGWLAEHMLILGRRVARRARRRTSPRRSRAPAARRTSPC